MPWLGPARFLPIALALGAVYTALTRDFVGDDAATWSDGPFIAGFWVLMCYGIARKDGSRPRRRLLAVISGGALFLAVAFAGVRLFPAADHAHPGPLRGLVYLIATISGVYAFTAVTHWPRRRDATGADSGEPSTDLVSRT